VRARLHLLLQARRQSSIHDQFALESGGKVIALGQTRRQVIVVSAVPAANIPVTVGIAVVTVSVSMPMPVAMIMVVVVAVIVVTIVLVMAVAITLG